MKKPKSKKYNKLIRDKIPEIIEASGSIEELADHVEVVYALLD